MSTFPALLLLLIASFCWTLEAFEFSEETVRGVNIGGWLVAEPWITPSIFDNTGIPGIVDEWTFVEYLGEEEACSILGNHWNTFYSASDFAYIAEAGLNFVRIPIGYWAFLQYPGEYYCRGQLPYLLQALEWARMYDLQVLVDIHGAPGSQNGFDNSGHRESSPGWQTSQSYIDSTLQAIEDLALIAANYSDVLVAIECVNEPLGSANGVLEVLGQFYYSCFGNVRYPSSPTPSGTTVVIHDAFQSSQYWNQFMPPPKFQDIVLDTHIYEVFTDSEVAMTESEHISAACNAANGLNGSGLWTVVGEWSTAITDCATYLNGRGIGARYDGTYPGSTFVGDCYGFSGSAATFSPEYKIFLRQFWEAQVITFERFTNGWIYWAWKTETGFGEEWSYEMLLLEQIIPWNVLERKYPNICG